MMVEGQPTFAVALLKASALVFASSKVTTASRFSKLTAAFCTPATLDRAFLTVIGHASQVMPGTDRVTIFVAAQAGVLRVAARAIRVASFFMAILSVEQRQDVGKSKGNQD